MTRLSFYVWSLVLLTPASVMAQEAVTSSRAEMSVPFGVAKGQLVTVGGYVVFVNNEEPDSSFAVRKSNIAEASVDDRLVTILTNEPVKTLSQFVFRLDNPAKAGALIAWAKQAGAPALAQAQKKPAEEADMIGEYQVRHEHRFMGGCDGKLIVTRGRVSFESVSEVGHSRQWDAADFKELSRPNPYKLDLRPFVGSAYTFEIVGGEGMSNREYKALSDMIAKARAPR